MLADPHSKQIPNDKNNYTEDEFQAVLALLADDDAPDNKRKQPEYWSDSDNDDWPKYDHKNKYPYDPTAEIPAEKRNVINLQQTANKQTTTTIETFETIRKRTCHEYATIRLCYCFYKKRQTTGTEGVDWRTQDEAQH